MPAPIEICLERLDHPEHDEAFLRCVALPEIEPGLVLDDEGGVLWMPERGHDEVAGLWVSGDEQLVLIRGGRATGVRVHRGGRSVDAPAGKPVVLLDQDVLELGATRRLRVHVHGATEQVHPPEPVPASAMRRLLRAAAAAVAISAAAGCPSVEVRDRPPVMVPARQALDCAIEATQPASKGIQLTLSCPRPGALRARMVGYLLDSAGKIRNDGRVVIETVGETGKSVTVTTKRGERPEGIEGAKVRFWIRQ